ncbi:MAG: methyltransferase domain-containing protein [Thermoplasmatales archaeon]|nr:methyltransferase domain-containing protein [Thermoplasmatales archaeon]
MEKSDSELLCRACDREYHIIEGIPSFTDIDPLFEDRFIEHVKPGRFENKWFYPVLEKTDITKRRISFLKKCLKSLNRNSLILDVGCGGGGWGLILKRYGCVVGLDTSLGSLKYAKNIYENVVHASVSRIPFPSNYFDAVVSEDVLGHIPFSEKEKTYSEMYRVLKPGGLMVHSAIETDSNSFWFRFAKKYPELFQGHHVDKHGHIGLELPSVIVERCKKIGFSVKKVDKMHAIILYPSILSAWFDNEYRNKSAAISAIVAISNTIQKSKKINLITSLILGIIEKVVNPCIDVDQATGLLLYCEK